MVRRFLLQGGDCAERYDHCDSATIANKLKILLQMSLVLALGGGKRVIRVGRFAGQYAKPRSDEFETRDGVTLASYRGDLINCPEFTEAARTPDPQLMLRGYERAALTLNFIRALVTRGFVDPNRLDYWNLDWVKDSPMAEEYQRIARQIGESIRFMESLMGVHPGELQWIDFFTSHEGLHLPYEQAQTRRVPRQEGWFDLSTHFPVDWDAHGRAARRARGVFSRHPQSDRPENRAGHAAGSVTETHRHPATGQ